MKTNKRIISVITILAMLVALISGFRGLPTGVVQAAANPQLPQVYLNTTYSPPTGNIITVNAGGNLQTALNNAQLGDTIVLQAGATFTGNFTLPNKTSGSGWIYIRTSAYSSIPAPGERVSISDASNMPKIVSPNTAPAIVTAQSAHHYRFVGIEITTTHNTTAYTNYNIIVLGSDAATLTSQLPTDIVFDRCYIHGTPTGNCRRGIMTNSINTSVVDSYLSEFHEVGADSQAIGGFNGPGPFKIVNNYLEGAGENVIFGGSDASIQGLVASDIEIRWNYFYKPLHWKPGDPSYAGISWSVKNLFELKNAQRVLIDGNIFENNWVHSQDGTAILFTPRNQYGGNPWTVVQDVTFTNNILKNSPNGFNLLGEDYIHPSLRTNNILIKDNVSENIQGRWILVSDNARDITVDHNTTFQTGNIISAGGTPSEGWVFRNNINTKGSYGVFGGNVGEGNACINFYFPGMVFTKNVIIGGNPSIYPSGNYFPSTIANVGFVNYASGNYRLASSSAYKNLGTDGKDLGADIDAIETATAGCISGVWGIPTIPIVGAVANREQVGYEASKAIDGITSADDANNRWSGNTDFAYVTLDLGSTKTVGSVDIDWYNVLNQQTTFDIKLSTDGVNFTLPVYMGTCAAQTGFQNYTFTAQSARYVRITGHYNSHLTWSKWVSITEARVKDNSGIVQTIVSAIANREQQGYEAAKVIDGITFAQNPDNRWSGDNDFAHITLDLGASKNISSVKIDWFNVVNQQTTFEILVSTDGISFTRVYNGTCAAQTGFQTYSFNQQQVRYVRIMGKANNNYRFPEWISISEVRVAN